MVVAITECHGYKITGRLPANAILLELNATVTVRGISKP